MTNITVEEVESKTRLDVYLAKTLPYMTRSQIKKWIDKGLIKLNDGVPSVHAFIKIGDVISISQPEVPTPTPLPEIPVITEDEHFIVINKPAGVLSHHAPSSPHELSITDWIKEQYPEVLTVGDPARPGLVHRLDRDTSGIMIIARTAEMYDHLKRQFHDHLTKKIYTALVHGKLNHADGKIDAAIGRSKKYGHMVAHREPDEKDRAAVTEYHLTQHFLKYDLIEAIPLTGRMHQIRVHLMSIGHPVVGDKLYHIRGLEQPTELARQFLHAKELTFTKLDGEPVTINAPLAEDLQTFLSTLK